MHKRKTIAAALVSCAAVAASAAPAQADFTVGMADQDFRMFESSRFEKLGIDKVRFLVPYDWFKKQGNEDEVKAFMERAAASDTDVLVHFTARRGCYNNGKYSKRKVCKAPKVKTYKKNVKRFLREFPETSEIGVWNEGNHVSQPTHNKPGLAAKYFLAARSVANGRKIVAADVLDSSNMESWLSGFDRKDKGKARIYGLHNYSDVNRKRSSGTTRLLRTVGGEVWLTETGGILKFLPQFRRSEKRQASATKYMFKLASRYDTRRSGMRGRITRLYNYQWTGAAKDARF
ncbi:MAG: glycosyl hydrolase, partial [Gaiellaceae bacterium]